MPKKRKPKIPTREQAKRMYSALARYRASLKLNHHGGKPKVMHYCKKCGKQFGARELRAHSGGCAGKRKKRGGDGRKS
jgi:hypothetical protein